ncbi:MAG: hypothetical protein ACKOYM_02775, partial [Actinomycetes bacterium]
TYTPPVNYEGRIRRVDVLRVRQFAIVASLVVIGGLSACGGSDSSTTTTVRSTTSTTGASALPPTMLDARNTSARVKVGSVVVFNLGDPVPGTFVAKSSDSAVFTITSTGGNQGTYTSNAGGVGVSRGTVTVTVTLRGTPADATVATTPPLTFTITVV